MKVLCVLLLYFICVNSAETSREKSVTIVDIVLTGLKDQSWSEEEKPCLDQTIKILNNVQNYTVWAVWIWNSMHHPVGTFYGSQYSFGNYDQCLHAPSKSADAKIVTQYCLADVILTSKKYEKNYRSVLRSTEPYIGVKTNIGRNLNKVTWGTCLPSACKPQSISKILKTIYLANPMTPADPEITVDACQVAGRKMEISYGFYAFFILITSLVVASVFSTYYLHNSNSKSGALQSIAASFNLKRNWRSLTKKSSGDIGTINLLKVSLATLSVGSHTALFEIMAPISNGFAFDALMLQNENIIKNAVKHLDLPVDNFLMVSGMLLMKGLMEKRKKPLIALIQRYFRLVPSFALVIFYLSAVSMYTGDGPVWQRFAGREQKACTDNWLLSVLMLNNYINSENICLLVSWYIPCDYQLAIMGTLMYLLWQRNRSLAKVATPIITVVAVLVPGIVTYCRQLPGMILFHDVEKIMDFRKNEVFLDTYIRSHNRAGPYIVGMAMGYIMFKYQPERYRNVISKEYSFILFTTASIVLISVITAPVSWASLEYDHLSSALYAVYSRNAWALSSCLVIGIVEYGDVGAIRKITNWHGFAILNRLTYGVYLTHSVILQQNLYSRRNLQQFDLLYSETVHGLGVVLVSGVVAMLLWLFVETPLNNIVNLVINGRTMFFVFKQLTRDCIPFSDFVDSQRLGLKRKRKKNS